MPKSILYADIVVIGGGASGLTAAIQSARMSDRKCNIVIVERLPRIGKKILVTGNGRCNLGNKVIKNRFYHGSMTEKAMKILAEYGDIEIFFNSLGLKCFSDSAGRLYPYSNSASSVLDALRLEINRLSVTELCNNIVDKILVCKNEFEVLCGSTTLKAKKIIFSTGGFAAPDMGTDGSAFEILKSLGHTIIKPLPSLAPVKTNPSLTKSLKGIRINAEVSAVLNDKVLKSESGELQFSDGALSGICIFNLSALAAKYTKDMLISINLMPEFNENDVNTILYDIIRIRYNNNLEDWLTGLFHKRIGQALIKQCTDFSMTDKVSSLQKNDISSIAKCIRHWEFPVTGISQWNTAQVTSGGVPDTEINNNLESKLIKGLYITGEAADIDGDCGGYNLNWAWASGLCAGYAAALSLKEQNK